MTKKQNLNRIDNCNHDEGDTCVILYAADGSQIYKSISIITVGTHVAIIVLCNFFSLSLNELWVESGVGENQKYLPIHKIAYSLGEETCRALPMWFTLTGCDKYPFFPVVTRRLHGKYGRCSRSYRNLCQVLIFMSVSIMHGIVFTFCFFISILDIEQINISLTYFDMT